MKFEDKHYVNTPEKLQALITALEKVNPEYLALDTETNGLKFYNNVVIGLSVSWTSTEGYYIPLVEWVPDVSTQKVRSVKGKKYDSHMNGSFVRVGDGKLFPEDVQDISGDAWQRSVIAFLKNHIQPRKLLMHNAPFDCNMLNRNLGVDLTQSLHCDTLLLKHVLDENTPLGLKQTAAMWQDELGFSAEQDARAEQKEMLGSVIKNGGEISGKNKQLWRADPLIMGKYAAADTALTYGLYHLEMKKFKENFKEKHIKWFFEDEVMPLCKNLIIPMQYKGTYIDVPYFKEVATETRKVLDDLEDEIVKCIEPFLDDFKIGRSLDTSVKQRNIIDAIIEKEGLPYPTKAVKGVVKPSLAQDAVKKVNETAPHWLWAFVLGEDEIKYSSAVLAEIKHKIYVEKEGRRHRFNIRSNQHLRWLFFTKLKEDSSVFPKTKSSTEENPIPAMTGATLKQFLSKKYDFVKLLLKFRKLDKQMSSYVEPALALNHNGWLHMDIMQAGTISGRFAFRGGFNLQTLPRVKDFSECPVCEEKNVKTQKSLKLLIDVECPDCGYKEKDLVDASGIKLGFIAPPGYKIVNADFAALEPRCFAFMSGDKKLKDIFWKDLDMYSKIYCDIEDREGKYSPNPKDKNYLKKVAPDKRALVKPVVLGIPYGARKSQVARLMGFNKMAFDKTTGEEVERLDVDRGKEFLDKYLSTYKDLYKYMCKCEMECVSKGYVETIVGRRRHFETAPLVYQILCDAGIDIENFLDMSRKKLEHHSPTNRLNRKLLGEIAKHMGLDFIDILERGSWAYVRALFTNEMNNAKNFPIQALAAHIANKSMLDISQKFRDNGIDGYVFLQVHDEISSYVREDQAELGAKLQQSAMEDNDYTKMLDIAMKAEPIICTNLKESK